MVPRRVAERAPAGEATLEKGVGAAALGGVGSSKGVHVDKQRRDDAWPPRRETEAPSQPAQRPGEPHIRHTWVEYTALG
jgi:hypothetical protein